MKVEAIQIKGGWVFKIEGSTGKVGYSVLSYYKYKTEKGAKRAAWDYVEKNL